jgi:hypothetical protein
MLTGESAPVLKSSLPLDAPEQDKGQYDPTLERDSKFRLLSGTRVVQVKRPLGPPSAAVNTKVGLSSVWDFDLPIDKHGKKRVRRAFFPSQHVRQVGAKVPDRKAQTFQRHLLQESSAMRNPLGDLIR